MRFTASVTIGAPAARVFAWHARDGAFERLVPPWESLRIIERRGGIEDGARTVLEMRAGPVPVRWTAVHRDYIAGEQFRDEQRGGPFAHWVHTHRVTARGPGVSVLDDDIDYMPPLGPLGALADPIFVRPRLERTFRYRHAMTKADIELHERYPTRPLRIAITGSSGLIGRHLVPFLTTAGHQVIRLARGGSATDAGTASWEPTTGAIDREKLDGLDAVVHLAGANIAGQRWSDAWKREIRDSRVGPTGRLCAALAALPSPPRVLVSSSAIGYYGDRGSDVLTEASAPGTGFLSDVGVEWEEATAPAAHAGIRVVLARTGIVLTPAGGALQQMLLPFRLGAGGPLGPGTQYQSWIGIDDMLGAIVHAIHTEAITGPMNATAPEPVPQREFARTLGRVLHRPALVPAPAFALRLMLGEMADPLLLASARVLPERLVQTGFVFRHPAVEGCLRHLLGQP